jgi:hypothetical protein
MKLRKPPGGVQLRRRTSGAASSAAHAVHPPCHGRPGSHVFFILVQHAALEALIVSLAVCFRALPFTPPAYGPITSRWSRSCHPRSGWGDTRSSDNGMSSPFYLHCRNLRLE